MSLRTGAIQQRGAESQSNESWVKMGARHNESWGDFVGKLG
jgi:hypothetical protein